MTCANRWAHELRSRVALLVMAPLAMGSWAEARGQTADVRSVALTSPSAAAFQLTVLGAPSGSDTSTSVPPSQPGFSLGASVFLEVWVQTTEPAGLSSASLDLSFDESLVTGLAVTHSSVFPEFPHGTIDNAGGVVDDLSGSHLGPCTDAVAVAPNWVRLASVEFRADADGVLHLQAHPTGSSVYGAAICGVGDLGSASVVYDSVTVLVGDATIPAASTWGLAALTLLMLISGTLVIGRQTGLGVG